MFINYYILIYYIITVYIFYCILLCYNSLYAVILLESVIFIYQNTKISPVIYLRRRGPKLGVKKELVFSTSSFSFIYPTVRASIRFVIRDILPNSAIHIIQVNIFIYASYLLRGCELLIASLNIVDIKAIIATNIAIP